MVNLIKYDFYPGKVFNKGGLKFLILDIQDDYLVLASLNKSKFIICNNYFTNMTNGQLDWMNVAYFDNFVDLTNALIKK